jgi:hypothetical protein
LIRPDGDKRITVSVGRGLPKFTSSHYVDIIEAARDDLDAGNFDQGVLAIVEGTARTLREIYRPNNSSN